VEAVAGGCFSKASDVFWSDGNGHDSWTCYDGAQDTVETAALVVAVVGWVVDDGDIVPAVAGGWGREVRICGASSISISGRDRGLATEMGFGTGAFAYGSAIRADEKGGDERGAFAGQKAVWIWGRAPFLQTLRVPGAHCGKALGRSVGDGGIGRGDGRGSWRAVGLSALVDDLVYHSAQVAGHAGDGLFDFGLDVLELVCEGEGRWSALADAFYERDRGD